MPIDKFAELNMFLDAASPAEKFFLGGVFSALIALGIIFVLLILIGLYVYSSLALYTIGKKLKYKKSWLAWIPIVNIAMFLQLGGFHWAWMFLILIPVLGWIALFVLMIISTWRIFEKRQYPGFFSLSIVIPGVGWILYLIAIGFVAWKDKSSKRKRY